METYLWFCGDLPNGDIEVSCGDETLDTIGCYKTFSHNDILNNKCPYCGIKVIYPDHVDW